LSGGVGLHDWKKTCRKVRRPGEKGWEPKRDKNPGNIYSARPARGATPDIAGAIQRGDVHQGKVVAKRLKK